MIKKTVAMALILLTIILVKSAAAVPWSQFMAEDGNGDFNKIEVFALTAGPIKIPNSGILSTIGPTELSSPAWSSARINGAYELMTGPTIPSDTGLSWIMNFDSPKSTPFTLDLLIWDSIGSSPIASTRYDWNGTGWTFGAIPIGFEEDRAPDQVPTPEPTTIMLISSGIGAIGIGKFFRKRKLA